MGYLPRNRVSSVDVDELKGFPQYFTFSLEKTIQPRHSEALHKGLKLPLPLMFKAIDEEFEELIRE